MRDGNASWLFTIAKRVHMLINGNERKLMDQICLRKVKSGCVAHKICKGGYSKGLRTDVLFFVSVYI